MNKTDECKHEGYTLHQLVRTKAGKQALHFWAECDKCKARTWVKRNSLLVMNTMEKIRRYPHDRIKVRGKNAVLGGNVRLRSLWIPDHLVEKLDKFVVKFGFISRSDAVRQWLQNLDF